MEDSGRLKVLLVEDDEDDYVLLRDLLSEIEGARFDLEWVKTFAAGLEAIRRNEHDVYLLDHYLGPRTGLELLRRAVEMGCQAPVIMLTGLGGHEIDLKAMQAGASDYLVKGRIDERLLERSIRYSLRHKRTLRRLRESEERYRVLFNSANDAVFVHGVDEEGVPGQFVEVNDVACRRLKYTREELLRLSPLDVTADVEPGDLVSVIDRLSEEQHVLFERVHVAKDGTRIPVEINSQVFQLQGEPVVLSIARDITRRKRMEAQLREYAEHLEQLVEEKVRELEVERAKVIHAGKLAALGELATGVAHELNQPLTAMQFEADYLKRMAELVREKEDWPSVVDVDEVAQVGDNLSGDIARCRRIIDHLRTFGRISDEPPVEIDLNTPIENAFILTEQRLRQHGIAVVRDLQEGLPPIQADPHRLEQVFLNLISNAEHALKEMQCRIQAGDVEWGDDYCPQLQVCTGVEDGLVVAMVGDNGCGIPHGDQEQIFEPFFSTKPVGEGTGLGLSISHGIINDFGGEIGFESAENEGTTFVLRFPTADGG